METLYAFSEILQLQFLAKSAKKSVFFTPQFIVLILKYDTLLLTKLVAWTQTERKMLLS